MAVVNQTFRSLFNGQSEPHHRARILAVSATHSTDWLNAQRFQLRSRACSRWPVTDCLTNCHVSSVRLWHKVDNRVSYVVSCKLSAGRVHSYHHINDLVWRAMTKAGIPSVKKPHGLVRSNGKRRDDLISIPWVVVSPGMWRSSTRSHVNRVRHICHCSRSATQRRTILNLSFTQWLFNHSALSINGNGWGFISKYARLPNFYCYRRPEWNHFFLSILFSWCAAHQSTPSVSTIPFVTTYMTPEISRSKSRVTFLCLTPSEKLSAKDNNGNYDKVASQSFICWQWKKLFGPPRNPC